MSETLVWHVHDVPENPGPEWVYCGRRTPRAGHPIAHRDSPYRNPYRLGCAPEDWGDRPWTLADVLGLYRRDLSRLVSLGARTMTICRLADGTTPTITLPDRPDRVIESLAGKKLVCWCAPVGSPLRPDEPMRCHAQCWSALASGLPLPEVVKP